MQGSFKVHTRIRTARRWLAFMLAGLLMAGAWSTTNAQFEDLDAALARNSGLVGVQLVLAEQPRGLRMLVNAAERGDRLAQYNLGVAYAQGRVTGRPAPEAALGWYRRAAAQGHASAAYNAGVLFTNGTIGAVDLERATQWMRWAADMRHAAASRWLARRDR
jgi:TPR repeat protein